MGDDHGFKLEDYYKVRDLAHGEYAVVEMWRSRKDSNIGNSVLPMVAIKRFAPAAPCQTDLFRSLALREAGFLEEAQHKNIVKFTSHIEHKGDQCLVLEFVPQTLTD
jgi:serine/threonine protein kinase